uniref:Uncharacterized protein n=1 Tax=Anopheles farauti TaxID=69004 RepID=A0A182QMR9_9DIPT
MLGNMTSLGPLVCWWPQETLCDCCEMDAKYGDAGANVSGFGDSGESCSGPLITHRLYNVERIDRFADLHQCQRGIHQYQYTRATDSGRTVHDYRWIGSTNRRFPRRTDLLGELQKEVRVGRYVVIRPGQILHVLDGARLLRTLVGHDEIAEHETARLVRLLRKTADGKARRRYERIVVGRRPVLMALGAAALLHRGQHHDQMAAFLLHHPPEIVHRRRQRALRGDVAFRILPVQLLVLGKQRPGCQSIAQQQQRLREQLITVQQPRPHDVTLLRHVLVQRFLLRVVQQCVRFQCQQQLTALEFARRPDQTDDLLVRHRAHVPPVNAHHLIALADAWCTLVRRCVRCNARNHDRQSVIDATLHVEPETALLIRGEMDRDQAGVILQTGASIPCTVEPTAFRGIDDGVLEVTLSYVRVAFVIDSSVGWFLLPPAELMVAPPLLASLHEPLPSPVPPPAPGPPLPLSWGDCGCEIVASSRRLGERMKILATLPRCRLSVTACSSVRPE